MLYLCRRYGNTMLTNPLFSMPIVQSSAQARKQSFAAANPLALGSGGGPRNAGLQTPLGWLTTKLTGVNAR